MGLVGEEEKGGDSWCWILGLLEMWCCRGGTGKELRSSNSRSFISSLKWDQISEIVTQFVWVAFDILNFVSIFPSLQLQRGLILGSLIIMFAFKYLYLPFASIQEKLLNTKPVKCLVNLGVILPPGISCKLLLPLLLLIMLVPVVIRGLERSLHGGEVHLVHRGKITRKRLLLLPLWGGSLLRGKISAKMTGAHFFAS